jgi:hypothetical protein
MNILDVILGLRIRAKSRLRAPISSPREAVYSAPAFFPRGFGLQNPTGHTSWPHIIAVGHNFGCEDYLNEINSVG